MSVRVGLVSTVGVGVAGGGRDRNEDSYLVCDHGKMRWSETGRERTATGDGDGVLMGVFDGMGGHRDGDLASATAARMMARLYEPAGVPRDPARALRRHVLDSHRALHWQARAKGPVKMGTTLTMVWILYGGAHWVHVGDSRLYAHRAGQLTQLSRDHTGNEFARRDGRPETPDGKGLAQNFIYGSRGLGDDTALRVETVRDGGTADLQVGDRLLLCTDGITGMLDDATLSAILDMERDPQKAAAYIVKTAMNSGSTDNLTAIIVAIDSPLPIQNKEDLWEEDDTTTGVF